MNSLSIFSNKWFSQFFKRSGSIGDVVTSSLDIASFQAVHGTGWVLADGSDVTGSEYHQITGNSNVPQIPSAGAEMVAGNGSYGSPYYNTISSLGSYDNAGKFTASQKCIVTGSISTGNGTGFSAWIHAFISGVERSLAWSQDTYQPSGPQASARVILEAGEYMRLNSSSSSHSWQFTAEPFGAKSIDGVNTFIKINK